MMYYDFDVYVYCKIVNKYSLPGYMISLVV